jgi:hypothetical protein
MTRRITATPKPLPKFSKTPKLSRIDNKKVDGWDFSLQCSTHHLDIWQSISKASPAATANAKGMVSQHNSRRTAGQIEGFFSVSIIQKTEVSILGVEATIFLFYVYYAESAISLLLPGHLKKCRWQIQTKSLDCPARNVKVGLILFHWTREFVMKYGMICGFMVSVLVFSVLGCQSRSLYSKSAYGRDAGTAANSIDGYAKAHGISRAEAAKRMRAEFVPPTESNANNAPAATTATSSGSQIR